MSTDWINKFIEVLNSDDAYAERAKHFSGLISLEILPSEGVTKSKHVLLRLEDGKCRYGKLVGTLKNRKPDCTISGPYSTWVDVVKGESELLKGLFGGDFKIKGEMRVKRKIWMENLRAIYEFERIMRSTQAKL
ncbi:MAG: SCP2 sterol-binding domain-containing protein [Candidatus Bathyarchaeia archaeon]